MGAHESSVVAVSKDTAHRFTKPNADSITLVEGLGVEGDAHFGATVQHRSRVAKDPTQPNLRQVHLIHSELFAEVAGQGFHVEPGQMGENITTRGVDLLGLPEGARLKIGAEAVVEITGLRNPCTQINGIESGLMKAMIGRDANGDVVRKAGVMGVVIAGGDVRPGDTISVELPVGEHSPLKPV